MGGEEIIDLTQTGINHVMIASMWGQAKELESLLEETKTGEPIEEIEDLKYQFKDLLKCDDKGRTCLHLAAMYGYHETALSCVKILLQCPQLILPEEKYELQLKEFIDMKDNNGETALHLAIANKAEEIVTKLIEEKAAVSLKSKKGVDALSLIYEKVPDSMKKVYDNSIGLTDDFKKLRLNFGPIIGYHQTLKEDPMDNGNNGIQAIRSKDFRHSLYLENWRMETEHLGLILKVDRWEGAGLLQHPLIKIFLHLKWKKLRSFIYASFLYHVCWLVLYGAAFLDLNFKVGIKNTSDTDTPSTEGSSSEVNLVLWYILLLFTCLMTAKEIYQCMTVRWTYLTFENSVQILFILCNFVQYGLLQVRYYEDAASASVIGILLATILMICQLGKIPYFGAQVAALTRVVHSCKPHVLLFVVWFLGFGLAFWALFFKTDEGFSILQLPAIITGMAAGELNLGDLMEKIDDKSVTLQLFSVFSLTTFIIVIATLYFNLLVGYAVSDIQLLKSRAEVTELSNKLCTIHNLESFLFSSCGRFIVRLVGRCGKYLNFGDREFDFLLVVPLRKFNIRNQKEIELSFDDIPQDILKDLMKIAHDNLNTPEDSE